MGVTQTIMWKMLAVPSAVKAAVRRSERANRVSPVLAASGSRTWALASRGCRCPTGSTTPGRRCSIPLSRSGRTRWPGCHSRCTDEAMEYGEQATRYGVLRARGRGYRRWGMSIRYNVCWTSPIRSGRGETCGGPPRLTWDYGGRRSGVWKRDDLGRVIEIWPLRSDKVRVIPDPQRYVKGFVYVGQGRQLVSYVAEDIVWMRYFNPLDEYAGLSPVAPLRLSADMGPGRAEGKPQRAGQRQRAGNVHRDFRYAHGRRGPRILRAVGVAVQGRG